MRAYVILVVLAAAVYAKAEEEVNPVVQFREDCIKESGVDPALITKAEQGEFTDDKSLKCFTKCFYIKQGWMDAQGKMQYEFIKSKIPDNANKDEALKVVDTCVQKKELTDPCEVAFDIHKCYYDNTPKIVTPEAAPPQ